MKKLSFIRSLRSFIPILTLVFVITFSLYKDVHAFSVTVGSQTYSCQDTEIFCGGYFGTMFSPVGPGGCNAKCKVSAESTIYQCATGYAVNILSDGYRQCIQSFSSSSSSSSSATAPIESSSTPSTTTTTTAKKFACNTTTGMCEESASGIYNKQSTCELLCEKEGSSETVIKEEVVSPQTPAQEEKQESRFQLPVADDEKIELPFEDDAGCTKFYRKEKIKMQAVRKDWERLKPPSDASLKKTLADCIKKGKELEASLKGATCDEAAYTDFTNKQDNIDQCFLDLIGLEEMVLQKEKEVIIIERIKPENPQIKDKNERKEERKIRQKPELKQSIQARVNTLQFRAAALEDPSVGTVLNACLDTELEGDSLKAGIESLIFIGEDYREKLAQGKAKLCGRVPAILQAAKKAKFSQGDLDEFSKAISELVNPYWDSEIQKLIEAKLVQLVADVEKGISPKALVKNTKKTSEERWADNGIALNEKHVIRFCDVPTDQWSFEVFQNPKQIAFKGSNCVVNYKSSLNIAEAVVALCRAFQLPCEEEKFFVPSELKNVPPWAKKALAAVTQGKLQRAKALRLTGSMTEPIKRWHFALLWHKLAQEEPAVKNFLGSLSSDEANVCENAYKDCGTFKKDQEVKDAFAFLRKFGIMTGKKDRNVDPAGIVTRAEAAAMLLRHQENVTEKLVAQ